MPHESARARVSSLISSAQLPRRVAPDGLLYTEAEFLDYFGDDGAAAWRDAGSPLHPSFLATTDADADLRDLDDALSSTSSSRRRGHGSHARRATRRALMPPQ